MTMETMAQQLNARLESDGVVQITTYGKSTLYDKRHAGWFSASAGSLYVRYGRGRNCLSAGERLLVAIRSGRYVPAQDAK